ncbi:hypothetical protein KSS87_016386 [Heliosperma pusillum]|nr:hypothetical protein KSS87_016386 [Heliosperma pusillum]
MIIMKISMFVGYGEMIYEDGYTVTTVIDGNKLQINPHSAVSRSGSHDLLLLDSSASVFYTLSFPLSQESVLKRFVGNEKGFVDGDAISAKFNKPRSFTVDSKGNAYVADRSNFAVRKISQSGVTTTIAGGYSKKPGRTDGPGRNVTFSDDYELTFVPEMCALLVMDHGNKLIRLINLKQENCGSPKSGLGMGAIWASAVIVPCLVGLVIGFAVRPYIMPHEPNLLNLSKSWTSYRTKLGRLAPMPYFGIRNATVSSVISFLRQLIMLLVSHVCLMFGFWIYRSNSCSSTVSKDPVSLLDCDNSGSSGFVISQKYANQLKDLVTCDGDLGLSGNALKLEDVVEKDGQVGRQIDGLMEASITNFTEDSHKSPTFDSPFIGVSSVVKRR